jgi:hypothetical protein
MAVRDEAKEVRVHHHTPTPVEISRQFVTYY